VFTEPVVFVFDVDHQLATQQFACWFQPNAAGVLQELRVQQDRRTIATNAVVGIEVLAR